MDVVRVFNNELSSLYEAKPPISKAKMTQITKSAIKGIKFYKHIVQSVEKFIQKCRPEYKVPGLYVVDSIVRQSRHQFGADKDVFGPRFVKNINLTFQQLFKCSPDERSKIIRVLNLWQKNAVFPIDVIQPLLDMGHPNSSSEWPSDSQVVVEVKESPQKSYPPNDDAQLSRHKSVDSQSWKGWPQANDEPVSENRTYAEMSTKNLEKFMKAEMSHAMEEEASRSRNQVKQEKLPPENTVQFNKKLLDFDYGDEEDEEEPKNEDNLPNTPNALALSMAQNLLSNPELLRQLQQMQQTIQQQNEALNADLGVVPIKIEASESSDVPMSPQQPPLPTYEAPLMPLPPNEADKDDRVLPQPPLPPQDLDERSLAALMTPLRPPTTIGAYLPSGNALTGRIEGDKDDRILPEPAAPPRDLDERSLAAILAPLERGILPPMPFTETSNMIPYQSSIPFPPQQPPLPLMEPTFPPALPPDIVQADEDERVMYSMPGEPPLPPQDFDERAIMMSMDERLKKERSRSRSGSRSRGRSGRHRSRSKSPRRKRSRSRSRSRKSSRAEERERVREKERERERERERKKKGLPLIKKGFVSVCSTTLWLGHVPKNCTEGDISDTFGEYGSILSIDMIPPRGCAFVVMDRRQDAHRAIQKLKNLKLQSSSVKMAWAPGKGMKGKEYKDYWEVDEGVSYVPYEKIPESAEALDLLEEGGFIDEESLPEKLKALRNQAEERSAFNAANKVAMETMPTTFNAMHAPPMVRPPIMPPASVNLSGMVLPPHLMQPQFGMPMPGMLPPQAMVMQVPMGIPPPNPMMMVQQQSQNIMNPQSLQMGMPQMIPRAVPPLPSALQSLKSSEPVISSPVPATNAGDATPTEEDGTSVSSPSSVLLTNSVTTSSIPPSTQQAINIAQFNPLLSLQNANRPMMSMPPPVSSTGTPIPYPPPNVNFNFPPPGVRPPGQALPNHQFPWMQQKPADSSFTDADSSHTSNSVASRPAPLPGMQLHMFQNRASFSEKQPPTNQNPIKEEHDSGIPERKSDISGNRSSSPGHHDMVISTDDESSLDHDYPRNDVGAGPRFQAPTEFTRLPMHNVRGPMQGMRFQRGGPFPMRMGGPRGANMHPGQRMEFPMHPGQRMPGGPHRGDNPPQEGRDWYPPDFDAPPFENRYENRSDRDEWQRDAWTAPSDQRRLSNDREDRRLECDNRRSRNLHEEDNKMEDKRHKNDASDDKRHKRDTSDEKRHKHDAPDDRRHKYDAPDDKRHKYDAPDDKRHKNEAPDDRREQPKPVKKSKPNKNLMDDMFKLRFYQRDKKPEYVSHLNKRLETKMKSVVKDNPEHKSNKNESVDSQNLKSESSESSDKGSGISEKGAQQDILKRDLSSNSRKEDREARKRSRWGRTLSEEREFQQQRRNEIEFKFQSYEQSSREMQQAVPNSNEQVVPNSNETQCDNSNELAENSENSTGGVSEVGASNAVIECNSQNISQVSDNSNAELLQAETIEHSKCETLQTSSETILTNDNVTNELGVVNTDNQISDCQIEDTLVDKPCANESAMVPAES